MNKTQVRALSVKKGITPKEMHEGMLQTVTEDSPSCETVKKWVGEFKRNRDS